MQAFCSGFIWTEPTDHLTDCYFCIVSLIAKGLPKKGECNIQTFYQLCVLTSIVKTYQSQKHWNRWKLCQMMGGNNETTKPEASTTDDKYPFSEPYYITQHHRKNLENGNFLRVMYNSYGLGYISGICQLVMCGFLISVILPRIQLHTSLQEVNCCTVMISAAISYKPDTIPR